MTFPSRLLAIGAAIALLADVPGLFTRGDVLRGLVVAFLAALAAAFGALAPGARRPGRGRVALLLLPLLVPLLGLIAWPGDGGGTAALLRLAAPWISLVALTLGALLVWSRDEDGDLAWRWLLIAGGAAGLWVLGDALVRGGAGVGPFGRPGIAGPVLGALFAAAWVHPALASRRVRIAVLVLLLAGLISTFSRVGIAAALLGTVGTLGLALQGRAGLWLRRAFVAGAAMGLLTLALGVGGHVKIPWGGETLDVRLSLYRASTRLIAEAPLTGHGLGSFPTEILRVRDVEEARISRGRRPLVGHDDYLHATTEGGIGAGLALLGWLVGLLAFGLAQLRRADRARRGATAAVMGALLTIGIAALGENVLLDPAAQLIAGLAAASLLAAATGGTSKGGALVRILALVLAGLALLVASVKGRDLLSDVQLRRYQDELDAPLGPLDALILSRDRLERGALHWRPDSAIAWYRLGASRANLKDGAHARKAYGEALRFDPGMTEARLDIASTYMAEGDAAQARLVLEDAVGRDPTRFDLRMRLGHLAMGTEPVPRESSGQDLDLIAALRAYNEAERLAPHRFEVEVAQARLARRRGQLEQTAVYLRSALETVAPEAARILRTPLPEAEGLREGLARQLIRRQRDALNALAAHPGSAEVLLESFRLAELEGKTPDVWIAGFLKLALLVNPGLAGTIETEARRFLDIGFERAQSAREAVKGTLTRPDYARADRAFDAAALRLSGLLQAELLSPDRVLREAQQDAGAKAWRLAYARYRALLSHAAALPVATGEGRAVQLDRLAELYSESAKIATRIDSARARHAYARARATRGAAHMLRGEWGEAKTWLQRAADDDPRDGEVRLALAHVHLQMEDVEAAETALIEAIELAPSLKAAALEDRAILPLLMRERVREALDRR